MFGAGLFNQSPTILTPAALAAGKAGYILDQYGAAISGPADTNENTLRAVTLPANALGVNGIARIWSLWSQTNNANVKTIRVKFGGTNVVAAAVTSTATFQHVTLIRNRNVANSQVFFAMSSASLFAPGGLNPTLAAIDTAADVQIIFTVQKATAGDTMTLEAYGIEVLPFGASIGA